MDKFKIDDVAKECGLTKRTIRYYEEIGLLEAPERSEGGTRLYTRSHFDQLKQIMNARDVLGFSLHEIQEYISVSKPLEEHLQGYRQSEDTELRREKLTEMERILGHQLQMIDVKIARIMEIRQATASKHTRVTEGLAKLSTPTE